MGHKTYIYVFFHSREKATTFSNKYKRRQGTMFKKKKILSNIASGEV